MVRPCEMHSHIRQMLVLQMECDCSENVRLSSFVKRKNIVTLKLALTTLKEVIESGWKKHLYFLEM